MVKFSFEPAEFIPFKDRDVIERVRRIRRRDITRTRNPGLKITVVPDAEFEPLWIQDIFQRIKRSSEAGEPLVMILPNPWPNYRKVAELINAYKVSCRHLHTFTMDEYADQDGNIAPESWEFGFGHAFKKFFISRIEPRFRPPGKQVHLLRNANLKCYSRMLADLGGADICYCGPGWTGHLAFIEPGAPEFAARDLAEWKTCGTRICTLHPLTIAQNSLHGCFGASGDLTRVPPKAATIGPADVIGSKLRIDLHAITVGGSFNSWQRLTTRLVLHGPVTPLVPGSIVQILRTDAWVSESAAADIRTRWDIGY